MASVAARLAPLWTEVLGVEPVTPEDNFFQLGGQSLTATRLLGRIAKEFGVSLRLRDVFAHPTVAGLAAHIAAAAGQPPRIRRIRRPTRNSRAYAVPLTPAQQGHWQVERVLADAALFNQVTRVDVAGEIELDLLLTALRSVVEQHDVLRTTIDDRDGTAVQTVHPDAEPPVVREAAEVADRDRLVRTACDRARREPFDLRTQIPIRARAITFSATDQVLIITTHHIAFDGWSRQLLVSDLAEAYRTLTGGDRVPTRPGIRYTDYAAWQADRVGNGSLEPAVAHWRERLAPPYADLRLTGAKPGGATIGTTAPLDVVVPAEVTAGVNEAARLSGTTVFTLLLTEFMALLADRSGSDEARVAVKVANRELAETQRLIGQFDNTVIVRARVRTPGEFLATVGDAVLDAFHHQDVPFEHVVDRLRADGADVAALLRVGFALHSAFLPELPVPGGTLRYTVPAEPGAGRPKIDPTTFDLVLELRPVADRIEGVLTYKTDVYEPDTVASFVRDYLAALESRVARPAGAAR